MTKHEIRQKILERRKNLSKKQVLEKSKHICRRLSATKEFKSAKSIMFYLRKDNEVDTESIIETALLKKKTICAPKVNNRTGQLKALCIKNTKTDLKPGCFGILEPHGRRKAAKNIDLIIVPGIAFDIAGYRIGWGKGFYDKFLEKAGAMHKIGLAFECQIVHRFPVDKHDIAMDKVITEKRTITGKAK